MDTPDETNRNGFMLGVFLGALLYIGFILVPENGQAGGPNVSFLGFLGVYFFIGLLAGIISQAGTMVLTLGIILGQSIIMFLFSPRTGEHDPVFFPFFLAVIVIAVLSLASSVGVACGHGIRQMFRPGYPPV